MILEIFTQTIIGDLIVGFLGVLITYLLATRGKLIIHAVDWINNGSDFIDAKTGKELWNFSFLLTINNNSGRIREFQISKIKLQEEDKKDWKEVKYVFPKNLISVLPKSTKSENVILDLFEENPKSIKIYYTNGWGVQRSKKIAIKNIHLRYKESFTVSYDDL